MMFTSFTTIHSVFRNALFISTLRFYKMVNGSLFTHSLFIVAMVKIYLPSF